MYLYNQIKRNPDYDMVPRTFIFGAKAAAGYKIAKQTIKLINNVANVINNDASIKGKIKVVFIENYRVSNGEIIFAAADVSEQISTASKEATEMFRDIYNSLLNNDGGRRADTYFILKDFRSYAEAQRKIDERYRDTNGWAKTVMTNTAKAGKFSSDRTIEEYATEIWKLTKTPVEM